MPVFPQLERLLWFHEKSKAGRFPNAARLAEQYEVSQKTAQRDINLLRDRFKAPLEYNAGRRGFYYTDELFELPCLPAGQQEILCLILARRLLDHAAGGYISRELEILKDKIFSAARRIGFSPDAIDQAFSATWSGYSPAQEATFRQAAFALLNHRLIQFTYQSPATNETTRRMAEPHHLQHYMASWVLTAWCRDRCDWRKFYLARMTELQVLPQAFGARPESQWRPLLEGTFGLFQGGTAIPVTLRFCPFRARWIKQQHWHPDQKLCEQPDGCLDLTLTVSDFREIKMTILQFGADVEVLAPEALRQEIAKEINKMGTLYRKGAPDACKIGEKKSSGRNPDV